MTAPFRLYGEFEGGEDAADEREAWFVEARDEDRRALPALIEAAKERKA